MGAMIWTYLVTHKTNTDRFSFVNLQTAYEYKKVPGFPSIIATVNLINVFKCIHKRGTPPLHTSRTLSYKNVT